MLPMNPRNIIREGMRRTLEVARARNGPWRTGLVVQPAEENPILIGITDNAEALSDEAVPKIVYDRRCEHGAIVRHNALVVIHERLRGYLPRLEWRPGIILISHRAHYGNTMLGVSRDVVIHLGNVFVLLVGNRTAEVETCVVEPVSAATAIRRRPRIEVFHHRTVRP